MFRTFAKESAPDMKIVGPGSVGEGVLMPLMGGAGLPPGLVTSEAMLSANPRPVFDTFSYHFYGAASRRCAAMGKSAQTTADAALSEEWLSRTERSYAYYTALRDRFEPRVPVWVTETADAACGGNAWASTFLDTFRYVDQLGRLARHGVNVVYHNTLASSEYGLLDQDTFEPRPNYWGALLWRRLMGTTVLDAGEPSGSVRQYAHCLRGAPGGVAVLAINTSRSDTQSLEVQIAAERYTLSARRVEDSNVLLNGQPLALQPGDRLPPLSGQRVAPGRIELAPATITFLRIADAGNPACR